VARLLTDVQRALTMIARNRWFPPVPQPVRAPDESEEEFQLRLE